MTQLDRDIDRALAVRREAARDHEEAVAAMARAESLERETRRALQVATNRCNELAMRRHQAIAERVAA